MTIRDDELERQAARLRWKAKQLELEAKREPGPVVLVAARPALRTEIPRGALAVGRVARGVGFRITPTYALALVPVNVPCEGGTALLVTSEQGEEWTCPLCGNPGAVTKTGAIRAHGRRGDDGVMMRGEARRESIALRMYHPEDTRRCVAIWANGRFDTAVVMRPVLQRMGCEQLTEWLQRND